MATYGSGNGSKPKVGSYFFVSVGMTLFHKEIEYFSNSPSQFREKRSLEACNFASPILYYLLRRKFPLAVWMMLT
jgi:hypothetical protein